jgi:signal transduction histidine kinase
LPLVTVLTGAVAGLFVLFIWLRRPQEVLYGLFGLAALLWALRTTTFVFDATPLALWPWWRMLYHGSTGGFIITLALFAQAQVGWWRPRVAWALGAYGLLGPLLYLTSGDDADELVGRWWVLGLAPIGVSVAALSLLAAWRQRSRGTAAIALALALAAGAGMHDYAVAWSTPWLTALAPDWVSHRLFLLHHAANALLMVMGALLTTRFIGSLRAVEDARLTLQLRVAERERELAAGYARIAELQREQAAQEATEQERQRIMQELHDGLGSQLFTSLLRAERGALQGPEVAETLRGAIDEMRVAIEALASEDQDLRTAFGNFRFRWEARLREAGLACDWQVQLPDAVMQLPPHDTLQLLRVAQEALTNVLKHAGAHQVQVALRQEGQALLLQVHDDGCGASSTSGAPPEGGRGLANMRARAARAGATLELQLATLQQPGTRVQLRLPLRQPLRAATAFT